MYPVASKVLPADSSVSNDSKLSSSASPGSCWRVSLISSFFISSEFELSNSFVFTMKYTSFSISGTINAEPNNFLYETPCEVTDTS